MVHTTTRSLTLICGLLMMAAPYRAHRFPRRRTFFAQEAYRGPPACYVARKARLEDNSSLPEPGWSAASVPQGSLSCIEWFSLSLTHLQPPLSAYSKRTSGDAIPLQADCGPVNMQHRCLECGAKWNSHNLLHAHLRDNFDQDSEDFKKGPREDWRLSFQKRGCKHSLY